MCEWVKCSEGMPDDGNPVWVAIKRLLPERRLYVYLARLVGWNEFQYYAADMTLTAFCGAGVDDVICWQEIEYPDPPEEPDPDHVCGGHREHNWRYKPSPDGGGLYKKYCADCGEQGGEVDKLPD